MSKLTPPAPAGLSRLTWNVKVVVPASPSLALTSSIDNCVAAAPASPTVQYEQLLQLASVAVFVPAFTVLPGNASGSPPLTRYTLYSDSSPATSLSRYTKVRSAVIPALADRDQ